jgi:hypothetical protein
MIALIILVYNLLSYPLNIGRALMYTFLIIPLILTIVDLGSGGRLSSTIDRHLSRNQSHLIQILIIFIAFIAVTIWGINYANTLFKIGNNQNTLGIMYLVDENSIYVFSISIALFITYYYAIQIYEYVKSKITKRVCGDTGSEKH